MARTTSFTEHENYGYSEGPIEGAISGIVKFMLFLMILGLVVVIGSVGFVILLITLLFS